MKPDRDQEPFLAITKELGRDPDMTPVSCPMRDKNGKRIGWGGGRWGRRNLFPLSG